MPRIIALCFCFQLAVLAAFGQLTQPGDIVFTEVSLQSFADIRLGMITTRDIQAGQTFTIVHGPWCGGTFVNQNFANGYLRITVNQTIPCGTQFRWNNLTSTLTGLENFASYNSSLTHDNVVYTDFFGELSGGSYFIVRTSTGADPGPNQTSALLTDAQFIYGLLRSAATTDISDPVTGWFLMNPCQANQQQSQLPPGLVEGFSAVRLNRTNLPPGTNASATVRRNNKLSCTQLTGNYSGSQIRAFASDTLYWDRFDGAFTPPCTFNVNCANCPDPSISSITSSAGLSPCFNSPVTLTVNGNLGGAAQWEWFSGSCGGTSLGTGSSLQINSGNQTQTIFVRPVGGCVINEPCQSITLTPRAATAVNISTQPADYVACINVWQNISVTAQHAVGYQWQFSTNGGQSFTNISSTNQQGWEWTGFNSTQLSARTSTPGSLHLRVQLTDSCGQITHSNAVTALIPAAPTFSAQPNSVTTCGGNTTFSVTASGHALSYQWQISTNNGVNWNNLTATTQYPQVNSATLQIIGTAGLNGRRYRCVVGSSCGSIVSDNALLTVNQPTLITAQPPSNPSFCSGSPLNISLSAQGTQLSYQWQVWSTFSGWLNISSNSATYPGATTNTLTVNNPNTGLRFRCLVSGACGNTTSNESQIGGAIAPPVITLQPQTQQSCTDSAIFQVQATGSNLAYLWQVSSDAGTTWTNLANNAVYSGATTDRLRITTAANLHQHQYRCRILSNPCQPLFSDAASLQLTDSIQIITQPQAQLSCAGNTVGFSVTVTGTQPQFQWQVEEVGGYVNLVDGGPYSGTSTATLHITAQIGLDQKNYRCVVSNPCNSRVSNAAQLRVAEPVLITQQPVDVTYCTPGAPSFSIATNQPGAQVIWQMNQGSGWTSVNLAGAFFPTSTILLVAGSSGNHGVQVRAIVSNVCGSDTSQAASFIEQQVPSPSGVIQGLSQVAQGSEAVYHINAVSRANAYSWQYSGTDVSLFPNDTSLRLVFGPQATSGSLTVIPSNNCGSSFALFPLSIQVNQVHIWQGSNWSNGRPNATQNARLMAPYQLSSALEVNHLQIDSGITLSLNDEKLEVHGNISGLGDIAGSPLAELVLRGNTYDLRLSQQNVASRSIQRVNIHGSNISLADSLIVTGMLEIHQGASLVTQGRLRLAATNLQTGQYINHGSGQLVGTAVVDQFIAHQGQNAFRFVAPPIAQQLPASAWQGVIPANNQLIGYNETNGYAQGYHPINAGNLLVSGSGYGVWTTNDKYLQSTGNLLETDFVWTNLSHTLSLPVIERGWHLLSNPFACTYAFDQADFDNMAPVYFVRDHLSDQWRGYHKNSGAINGGSRFLAPGQGYFIQALGGINQMTFGTSGRVMNENRSLQRNSQLPALNLQLQANGHVYQTQFVFSEHGSLAFDPLYDARYMLPYQPETPIFCSMTNDGWETSLQNLPDSLQTASIPLRFKAGTNGNFQIGIQTIGALGLRAILEDRKLGIHHVFAAGSYHFQANVADGDNRFVLHLEPSMVSVTGMATDLLQIYTFENRIYLSNHEHGQLKVFNMNGQEVLNRWLDAASRSSVEANLPAGVYLVQFRSHEKFKVQKIVIKI